MQAYIMATLITTEKYFIAQAQVSSTKYKLLPRQRLLRYAIKHF
jgi:hypothetical protein